MKYIAQINIMPLRELLDPQGKAVTESLHNLGLKQIDQVRIGKNISLQVNADSEEEAKKIVENACKKLLANMVMESYAFTVSPA